MHRKNDSARLLTRKEAAELLHISERTVQRRIEDGELAAHKLKHQWRIARVDIEDYLRRNRFGRALDVL